MRRYFRLTKAFFRQHVKVMMEYRANFALSAGGAMAWQAAVLAGVWAVMGQVDDLNGWSRDQVFLIYALLTLASGLSRTLAQNLYFLGQGYLRPGRFDGLLVRPVNPLFHLLADRFSHEGLGDLITGLVLVVHCFRALAIPGTVGRLLCITVTVVAGGVIISAISLAAASTAFWITIATPVNLALGHMIQFAMYPLSIYRRPVQLFLTWLLPYGLVSFYPAQYMLGRGPGLMVAALIPVAALLWYGAYRFWLVGLGRYAGTGS
jgi:ABC-2 type transport system permease protein